jgi:hypothetical protein
MFSILEKLIVSQLVNIFPSVYRTRRYVVMFTTALKDRKESYVRCCILTEGIYLAPQSAKLEVHVSVVCKCLLNTFAVTLAVFNLHSYPQDLVLW